MTTRKEIAEAFRVAKGQMRGYSFICNELPGDTAGLEAQRIVKSRIETQNYTARDWIERHLGRGITNEEAMQYRLAWLDSLIAEFSKPAKKR